MSNRLHSAPSAAAKDAVDDLKLDFIAEAARGAATYARDLERASRRRDRMQLVVRLRQLRCCSAAIGETLAELGVEEPAP